MAWFGLACIRFGAKNRNRSLAASEILGKKAGRKHQVCRDTTHEVGGLGIGLCGAGIMTL